MLIPQKAGDDRVESSRARAATAIATTATANPKVLCSPIRHAAVTVPTRRTPSASSTTTSALVLVLVLMGHAARGEIELIRGVPAVKHVERSVTYAPAYPAAACRARRDSRAQVARGANRDTRRPAVLFVYTAQSSPASASAVAAATTTTDAAATTTTTTTTMASTRYSASVDVNVTRGRRSRRPPQRRLRQAPSFSSPPPSSCSWLESGIPGSRAAPSAASLSLLFLRTGGSGIGRE